VVGADLGASEEIRAVLMRFLHAWETRDAAALEDLVSNEAYVLGVGTDASEWWRGQQGITADVAHLNELPSFTLEVSDVAAHARGETGWAAARLRVKFDNGVVSEQRQTYVFTIERGHWRLVQWHRSVGIPNEQALGVTLTTTIQLMEHAVREDRPDVGPATAPDGTVTVMFSDIESSTVLLDRLGDNEFVRLLAWHDTVVRGAAREHRGFVVKSQGDGFMIAFPSAALALRCGLVIQERLADGFEGLHVRVRIGLHAGEAVRHADDFYGRTVVIAARIGEMALGGEVLVSELVHELVRGLGTFQFGEPRTAQLKGLEEEFRVYPLQHGTLDQP
jgi:class 3 adenylate cyclase/ketosteroid isomerase-like protein